MALHDSVFYTAGMSIEEMKELSLDLMPYLQPQAIAAIPPEGFSVSAVSRRLYE